MKIDKRLGIGVLVLALVLPLSVALAGTTGKIAGRVLDDKGAPLPGVNVILEGTKRGAITGTDGSYFILSVDPGGYSGSVIDDCRQPPFACDVVLRLLVRLGMRVLELPEHVVPAPELVGEGELGGAVAQA